MNTRIVIYAKDHCPYCKAAKALLTAKGVGFADIEISDDPEERAEMVRRSGGRTTVPQVFVGNVHVGGYSDLATLNTRGGLDALLRPAAAA